MESDSRIWSKHSQDSKTNRLSQASDLHNQLLVHDNHITPPATRDELPPAQSLVVSSCLLSLAREVRNKILYYVLCPPDAYYCYTGFGRIMRLEWGEIAKRSTRLQGLPTVLAVNKQLQEETIDILYADVMVQITMCDDYEAPSHWRCPKRIIDLSRLMNVAISVTLKPACPTRSDFPPLLIAAQRHGLNIQATVLQLQVFTSLLKKNHRVKQLDVLIGISWKMMDTAESVKGIEYIIWPLIKMSNVDKLRFVIEDSIERREDINPAKHAIGSEILRGREMRLATTLSSETDQVAVISVDIINVGSHKAANVRATVENSTNTWTSLHQAASDGHEADVLLCLESGANIEARDKEGFTALGYAASRGHEVAVQLLVEAGADIDSKGTNGWTPLHRAARNGHEAVVQLLIGKGVDIEAQDNVNGYTALHHAARNGHEGVVRLLLGHQGINASPKDHSFLTPLAKAAEKGHEAVIKLLLEHDGVDPNSRDRWHYTPLLLAVRNGHEGVGKLLLGRKDVDANAADNGNRTPLCLAAEKGHLIMVQLLLGHKGVIINPRDHSGRTPLSKAVEKGHQGIVTLLLSLKDIDADSRDYSGRSPLSLAAENGDEALVMLLLEREDIEVESKDNGGRSPLSWARSQGPDAVKVMRQLLDHNRVSMEETSVLDAIFDLASLYEANHDPNDAEEMYKRALEGRKKVLGLEHPSTLDTIHSLGTFYADQSRLAEAEEMFHCALQGYERTIGIEHNTTLGVVHDLGVLYRFQGKLSNAKEMLQRSLEGFEKSSGLDHDSTLKAAYNLGAVYQDQCRFKKAEEMYQRALIGFELAWGCSHPFSRRVQTSIKETRERCSVLCNHLLLYKNQPRFRYHGHRISDLEGKE